MTDSSPSWPPISPTRTVGQVGERALIRYLRSRIGHGPDVLVGVGDDAAAVQTAGLTLVTTNGLAEGVHFRREWSSAHFLGRKALTASLADIAAMAGAPRFAMVSLFLPAELEVLFVEEFYDGFLERAAETGVDLVGGNLTGTFGALTLDVTLLGEAQNPVRREGARPGDLVVVTGALGAAAAAVPFLEDGAHLARDGSLRPPAGWNEPDLGNLLRCVRAQVDPAPPLAFTRAVGGSDLLRAAMDLSDGISGDLLTLCQENDVSAWIDGPALPVEPAAARLERSGGQNAFSLALHGDEDYEMLFAVAKDQLETVREMAQRFEVPLSVIGRFEQGPPGLYVQFGETTRRLRPRSHDHFADPLRERRSDPARDG